MPRLDTPGLSVKAVLVASMTVLAVVITAWIAYEARVVLALILIALLLAVALHHGVDFLQRHRLRRRGAAVALMLGAFFGVLLTFVLLIVPPAVRQARILASEAPQLIQRSKSSSLYRTLDRRFDLERQLDLVRNSSAEVAPQAAGTMVRALGGILSGVAGLLTLVFVMISALVFGPGLVQQAMVEASPNRRKRYERVVSNIYHSLGGYLSGLALLSACNTTATAVFLALTRIPFFLPLGIVSGLSSTVPYVGPTVVGVVTTLIVFATKGFGHALATAVYFVAYGQFEGNFLGPVIFRQTAHVNPLVSLVAVLIGGDFAGVAGALLAVPTAATGQIVLAELLRARKGRLTPLHPSPDEARSTPPGPTPVTSGSRGTPPPH